MHYHEYQYAWNNADGYDFQFMDGNEKLLNYKLNEDSITIARKLSHSPFFKLPALASLQH